MSSFAYDNLVDDALSGNIQKTDTFYVMLVTSAYTPNQGTHAKRSDVSSECAGTGYTAGGQAIVPTFTRDTTNHRLRVVFPAITWPNSTVNARRAVYYKRRGGAASADELVAQDDFGADVASAGTTFSLAATTINLNSAV
jgi:hypothetical protein